MLFLIAAFYLPVFSQGSRISIEITNIRSEKGLIRLALYDHKDQFPDDPSRSYDFPKTRTEEDLLEVILNDIPPGTYAISILDDEDEFDLS